MEWSTRSPVGTCIPDTNERDLVSLVCRVAIKGGKEVLYPGDVVFYIGDAHLSLVARNSEHTWAILNRRS